MSMRAESLELLTRANVPPEQALAFVRVIDIELDARGDTLATKADIEGLKQATKADVEGLKQATKADVEGLRQATKSDIEGLRQATKADVEGLKQATKADIDGLRVSSNTDLNAAVHALELKLEGFKSELVRWVFTCIMGQTAVLLGAAYFVTTLLQKSLH